MSVLQRSVSSLQDQPHPAGKANSALGGAQFGAFEVNFPTDPQGRHDLRKK